MTPEISQQIFEKCSDTKFCENPSYGSRVPCVRMDGREDMKLIVAFRDFAIAPTKAVPVFLYQP